MAMFEMVVSDAFSVSTRGTVLSGQVRRGTIRLGDKAILKSPAGEMPVQIAGVEVARTRLDLAKEGENAGVLCHNLSSSDLDRHTMLDGDVRRFQDVVLVSAPARWWEFWRA